MKYLIDVIIKFVGTVFKIILINDLHDHKSL